jgi:hypothetical protein
MGADKNSSRSMNSAYAPNSQPRVPTWICQGHVVTMDLLTLGTNPNSKKHGSATQEAKDLGNLQSLGRTVRGALAYSPQGAGRRSTRSRRTVRKRIQNHQCCTSKYRQFVPYPRTVREPLVPHGWSASLGRTIREPWADGLQTPSNEKQLPQ